MVSFAGDLRALQGDPRQHGVGNVLPVALSGQGEDLAVQRAVRRTPGCRPASARRIAASLMSRRLAEAAHGQFGGARRARAVADQIAIQRQRNPRDATHRALERGVATGIPAGVEVGEAVPAAPGSPPDSQAGGRCRNTPPRRLNTRGGCCRPADGIAVRVLLGESDADPASARRCTTRLSPPNSLPPMGTMAMKSSNVSLSSFSVQRRGEALAVGAAIGRLDIQRRADQERRHVQLAGTTLDLAGGDPAQAGHRRVDLVGGLLSVTASTAQRFSSLG